MELLCPPTVPAPLRALLSRAQDLLSTSAPFQPQAVGAEALGARPHALRGLVEEWAQVMGVGAVEIFVADSVPEMVRPVGGATRAVVVPRTVTPSLGLRFAVARAMLLDAVGPGRVAPLPPPDPALPLPPPPRPVPPRHPPPTPRPAYPAQPPRHTTHPIPTALHTTPTRHRSPLQTAHSRPPTTPPPPAPARVGPAGGRQMPTWWRATRTGRTACAPYPPATTGCCTSAT